MTHQARYRSVIIITLIWAALFAARLTGHHDLRKYDQERPASYVMDIVQNGNWACLNGRNRY